MDLKRPEISVILPVFNEAPNLSQLERELKESLSSTGREFELIWVDDGSVDESLDRMRDFAARDHRQRVIRLVNNAGLSAALAAGFQYARGQIWVTLDTDLQHDPADIPSMLLHLDDCDVVCGIRAVRDDHWLRKVSSKVANTIRNWSTGESIQDVGCTLRVYRAPFVKRVAMFDGMHRFLPTLLKLEGARIKEVPVSHRARVYGSSKYNIRNRLWVGLTDLFAVRWMQRRHIKTQKVEEVHAWNRISSGSDSDSSAKRSSSLDSLSSGSPPKEKKRASFPPISGS